MSFNKSIPNLTLVADGLTGETNNLVRFSPTFTPTLIATGYGTQFSNGIANINLPAFESNAVDDATLELQALSTSGLGLTGTITRDDLPFSKIKPLIVSGSGLSSINGSGALSLPKLLVSGSSSSFAKLNLKPVAILANGKTGTNGYSVLFMQNIGLSASGSSENIATANLLLPAVKLSASPLNGTDGQHDKPLPRLRLVASGLTGTTNKPQAITLPVIEIDADGVAQSIGTASIRLPAIELAASVIESVLDAYSVDSTCYVMNTSTNAMTEYTNFKFNSFATFKGKTIGANDGGIFELLGSNDNGADIAIEIDTGTLDFGSEKLKRLLELYFGYRSDGDLDIQVIVDDHETYDYTLGTQGHDGIYTNRLKLGKGMKGRYFQVKINGNGVAMELDSFSADPIELSRKVS